jgi:hypothetical protein
MSHLNDKMLNRVYAMLRVEYDLSISPFLKDFEGDITISDFTRSLPPKIREEAYALFAKMDEEKKNKLL